MKGADASLAMCGTVIEVNSARHAIIAVAVKENALACKLPDLVLHW